MLGLPGALRQNYNLPGSVALLCSVLQSKKYAMSAALLARGSDRFIAAALETVRLGTISAAPVDDLWEGIGWRQVGLNQRAIVFFGTI